MVKDWWTMSLRLRRYLMTSPRVFGFKWYESGGNIAVRVIRAEDAYKENK